MALPDDAAASADEQPTRVDTPRPVTPRSGNGAVAIAERTTATRVAAQPSTVRRTVPATPKELATIASPVDALRRDEIARVRIFARLMIAMALFGLGIAPVIGGDHVTKPIFLGSVVVVLAAYGALLLITRNPAHYTEQLVAMVAQACALAASGTVYFFGLFSPAPMIVAIGLYVYSLGTSFKWSFATYVNLAIGQAGLFTLTWAGVIADRGLVRGDYMDVRDQILVQICVQFVYLMCFFIGRASRKKSLESILALEGAVREIAEREALLNEARMELERAGWVGGPGRFTDQTLGSFRLGVIIGRGGMGEVYEAEHLETGEKAAVKLLQRNVLHNEQHVARFVREATIAAKLQVPNVVRVLEIGGPDSPIPFIAMELLSGCDLAQHLRKRRRLSAREVIDLVRQVGTGLDAAKQAGVVHRDLKPQNLFRADRPGEDPVWKTLDFGVSKLAGHGGTLTQGNVVGTPAYMAPEQAQGGDVDHLADLYGLAAIAYRSLTGRPPYSGNDIPATLYNVVHAMPQRPGKLVELESDIDAVLAVGLAKKRGDRFQSARELADALQAAARGQLSASLRRKAERLLQLNPWRVVA